MEYPVRFRPQTRDFLLYEIQTKFEAHLSILFNEHRKLLLGFKRPELEAEHSQSCSAEAKNANSPPVLTTWR